MTVEENFPAKQSHLHSSGPVMYGQNNDIKMGDDRLKSRPLELHCILQYWKGKQLCRTGTSTCH